MKKLKRLKPSSDDPTVTEKNERELILEALRKSGWNVAKAAKSIRITHSQFVRLLRKYGLRDVL